MRWKEIPAFTGHSGWRHAWGLIHNQSFINHNSTRISVNEFKRSFRHAGCISLVYIPLLPPSLSSNVYLFHHDLWLLSTLFRGNCWFPPALCRRSGLSHNALQHCQMLSMQRSGWTGFLNQSQKQEVQNYEPYINK